MGFKYKSGEDIRCGDRVLVHGEPGEVELAADPLGNSLSEADTWYVSEFGGGVIFREPKAFGRIFFSAPETEDHLAFVARADS